jgi:hypothetical protein
MSTKGIAYHQDGLRGRKVQLHRLAPGIVAFSVAHSDGSTIHVQVPGSPLEGLLPSVIFRLPGATALKAGQAAYFKRVAGFAEELVPSLSEVSALLLQQTRMGRFPRALLHQQEIDEAERLVVALKLTPESVRGARTTKDVFNMIPRTAISPDLRGRAGSVCEKLLFRLKYGLDILAGRPADGAPSPHSVMKSSEVAALAVAPLKASALTLRVRRGNVLLFVQKPAESVGTTEMTSTSVEFPLLGGETLEDLETRLAAVQRVVPNIESALAAGSVALVDRGLDSRWARILDLVSNSQLASVESDCLFPLPGTGETWRWLVRNDALSPCIVTLSEPNFGLVHVADWTGPAGPHRGRGLVGAPVRVASVLASTARLSSIYWAGDLASTVERQRWLTEIAAAVEPEWLPLAERVSPDWWRWIRA